MANKPAPLNGTTPVSRASWSGLPPETQIQILEYTDLVAPTCHVIWSTSKRFYLDDDDRDAADQICWKKPLPIFLVSRLFYQRARDVFWGRNKVTVRPDTSFVWQKPDLTRDKSKGQERYAISQLLDDRLSPHTIPFVRSLQLRLFKAVRADFASAAREDWFRALAGAMKHGLQLLVLDVDMDSHEDLGRGLEEAAPTDKDKVELIHGRVRERVWPHFSHEGVPLAISKRLFVQFPTERLNIFYDIRKNIHPTALDRDHGVRDEAKGKLWGTPRGTRQISIPGDCGKEETWVETLWVLEKPKDEWL
jgi:hypothetical protein